MAKLAHAGSHGGRSVRSNPSGGARGGDAGYASSVTGDTTASGDGGGYEAPPIVASGARS